MDLLTGLVAGALIAWAVKDGSVWALAELVDYWRTECLAAEGELRAVHNRERRRLPRVRPRVPGHLARSRAVRTLAVLRPMWPGYRQAT